MTTSLSIDEPRDSPPSPSPRMTWQEFAALVTVLGFIDFLWIRGVPLERAIIAGISTLAAVVFILKSPQTIAELIRLLRELVKRLGSGGTW